MCLICRRIKKKLGTTCQLLSLFLIAVLFSMQTKALAGTSNFYDLQPNCTINQSYINNCNETSIKLNCVEPNPQFIMFMTYNINSTNYLSSQLLIPNQHNFTVEITLKRINQTINMVYNWSDVVITDTNLAVAIYMQNLIINHSCSDCFQNIILTNSSCGSNDIKNYTYIDTNSCMEPLPSNYIISCDFCNPDWQCSNYSPSTCSLTNNIRNCIAVKDMNSCFNQTFLPSDNFTGNLDDFIDICSVGDFRFNQTLYSTLLPELAINKYPYIKVNETINMEITVKLANIRQLIENVQMQIEGETIKFNQDNASISYKKSIQISEVGDYPFIITGRDSGVVIFQIQGKFYVRNFANVGIELFENKAMSTKYLNNFAEVVAIKYDDNLHNTIGQDLTGVADVLNTVNIIAFKLAKINQTARLNYRNGIKMFHAPYRNGRADLEIPIEENSTFEVRLLNMQASDEYIFDNYDYTSATTYDTTFSNDIFLTKGKVKTDTDLKMLVSAYDVRFWENAKKWLIVGGIALLFIIISVIIWVATQEPELVIKFLIAGIGLLIPLYFILSFFWH